MSRSRVSAGNSARYQASKTGRETWAGGRRHSLTRLAAALGTLAERASQPFALPPGRTAREEADRQQADDVEPSSRSRPPLTTGLGPSAGNPIVAVLLFGLDRDEVERLLPIVERDCSERKMTPLCLVDMDSFELFRMRGVIFEYLPSYDDRARFDSSLHWDLYMQRRLALIRQKWNPARVVAFGTKAMNFLALWSSSPFETTPLPAATGPHGYIVVNQANRVPEVEQSSNKKRQQRFHWG